MTTKTQITQTQKEVLDEVVHEEMFDIYKLLHWLSIQIESPQLYHSQTIQKLIDAGFTTELMSKCLFDSAGYEVIEEDQMIIITKEMRENLLTEYKKKSSYGKKFEQLDERFNQGMRFALKGIGVTIKGITDQPF